MIANSTTMGQLRQSILGAAPETHHIDDKSSMITKPVIVVPPHLARLVSFWIQKWMPPGVYGRHNKASVGLTAKTSLSQICNTNAKIPVVSGADGANWCHSGGYPGSGSAAL
jgi:hypothetical protein